MFFFRCFFGLQHCLQLQTHLVPSSGNEWKKLAHKMVSSSSSSVEQHTWSSQKSWLAGSLRWYIAHSYPVLHRTAMVSKIFLQLASLWQWDACTDITLDVLSPSSYCCPSEPGVTPLLTLVCPVRSNFLQRTFWAWDLLPLRGIFTKCWSDATCKEFSRKKS